MAELTTGEIRSILTQTAGATAGAVANGVGNYKDQAVMMGPKQTPLNHMAEEIGIAYQGRFASVILERRSNKAHNEQNTYLVPRVEEMDEEMSFAVANQKVTKKQEIDGIDNSYRKDSDREIFQFDLKTLLESFSELEENRLEQFYQDIVGTKNMSGDRLREMVQQHFADPSFQYVATLFCYNKAEAELLMLKEQGDADIQWLGQLGQLVKLLRKEVRWYEDNYGRQIRASVNISRIVRDLVSREKGLLGQELHQFYRDAVLDYSDLRSLYGMIMRRYTMDRFKWAVEFLMKSLTADYDAQGPSITKDKLKAIMDDIFQLHVLESVHLQCAELYGQMTRTMGSMAYSVEFLLEQLLAYQASDQPGMLAVTRYMELLHFMDRHLWERIFLLNGTKKIIRLVPLKMFKEKKARDNQLDSIQSLLDEYSEAEDEEAAAT